MEQEFNIMQLVKRRLFAMRNGLIADTLRKAGSPFKIIFGLNIPQIKEIADEFGFNMDLANRLWANTTTRESMLLAPMLMNPENISAERAIEMVKESPAPEITDSLCHKLLRLLPESFVIAQKLAEEEDDMSRYAAIRLFWHHIASHNQEIKAISDKEYNRNCRLTKLAAQQLLEEIDFLYE